MGSLPSVLELFFVPHSGMLTIHFPLNGFKLLSLLLRNSSAIESCRVSFIFFQCRSPFVLNSPHPSWYVFVPNSAQFSAFGLYIFCLHPDRPTAGWRSSGSFGSSVQHAARASGVQSIFRHRYGAYRRAHDHQCRMQLASRERRKKGCTTCAVACVKSVQHVSNRCSMCRIGVACVK